MFTTAARHQSFSLHAKAVRSAGGRYQWTTARDGRCSRAGYLKGQPRVIVATHPGLRVGGFTVVVGHLNSTGTLPAAAAAAARACTASIAIRALTILLYSSTGVGCIRSGSIRISGTQIGPPRSVIALFCCRASAIADCRSAGPQLERGRRADPLRQMHPRRAAATRVGRPGHHRGQPIRIPTTPQQHSPRPGPKRGHSALSRAAPPR